MNEFQILDQVVPDSTSLQQRSIFQVINDFLFDEKKSVMLISKGIVILSLIK